MAAQQTPPTSRVAMTVRRGSAILFLFSFSHYILNDVDTSNCKAMISMIKATCFFSNTFPPTFMRLIGLYFEASFIFSLPGFGIGIILEIFHFFGKHPVLTHSL